MDQPSVDDLRELVAELTDAQIEELVAELPPLAAAGLLDSLGALGAGMDAPTSPIEQALDLDEGFRPRAHLRHLSDRIAQAVADVEAGVSRRLIVEMPPRAGKTTMATLVSPAWILRRHPSWPIALTSHDGQLATSWGRQIRRWVEDGRLGPDLSVARDAGAASSWETTEGGKLLSISIRESFTGRGAKVLVIDDPHKDFIDAHSATLRQNLWDWWLSVAQTRLEPPYLVIVVMTRWHEDDFVGRLLSVDHEGSPADWTRIRLPALAEADDALGRPVGEPLLSPLLDETAEEARQRWLDLRRNVGTYTFSAMYQQSPAPAQGAIFNAGWWRFWTSDPEHATPDGRVVLVDPESWAGGRWLDSWDAAFKGTSSSDWVVGQRWVRRGAFRYLVDQRRGRWSFTETIEEMKLWADPFSTPTNRHVHQRLIEDKANGPAIIDTLSKTISGIKPINPKTSKEARARSITPECESGHVLLPYPGDPGNEWVTDLLSELRNFPHDVADDQVDALTQALAELRDAGGGGISIPGRSSTAADVRVGRNVVRAARTDLSRPRPRPA